MDEASAVNAQARLDKMGPSERRSVGGRAASRMVDGGQRTQRGGDGLRRRPSPVPMGNKQKRKKLSWLKHWHINTLLGFSATAAVVQWAGVFHV